MVEAYNILAALGAVCNIPGAALWGLYLYADIPIAALVGTILLAVGIPLLLTARALGFEGVGA